MSQSDPCMNVASDGEEKFSDELPASIPRNLLDVDMSVSRPTGSYSSVKQHLISRPVARSLENLQRLLKSCLVLSLSVCMVGDTKDRWPERSYC